MSKQILCDTCQHSRDEHVEGACTHAYCGCPSLSLVKWLEDKGIRFDGDWIMLNTPDDLPEKNRNILVSNLDLEHHGHPLVYAAYYTGPGYGKYWFHLIGGGNVCDVIAWMPYPKAIKQGFPLTAPQGGD